MTSPVEGYYSDARCDLLEFSAIVERDVQPDEITYTSRAPHNVPVYDYEDLAEPFSNREKRQGIMAEWARILKMGSGVFAIRGAQSDLAAIDAATQIYNEIIDREKRANNGGADHFAEAGSNDRIWNSLQKLCTAAPETYISYFACPAVDAACEAWLGPNYQMTAQVNVVHPGGKAQQAHRDYHLGFQTAEVNATYPAHVHDLSPLMTLQGGIAHCDMPISSGPTKLLPFSQLYRPGYVAWRREDFRQYFEEHCVQLPLEKGDALFFNPALFHAAGENSSPDIHRMINLFQISSAFGRPMESVDRLAMCRSVYAPLCAAWESGNMSELELDALFAATAEGYSFPTNLDKDPPVGGLAPETQKSLLKKAVLSKQGADDLFKQLDVQIDRRSP